jgi:hypothetical protein
MVYTISSKKKKVKSERKSSMLPTGVFIRQNNFYDKSLQFDFGIFE